MFFNNVEYFQNGIDLLPPYVCTTINVTYKIFLAYCVSNTLAPKATKQFIINATWYALELYTIAEMNINRKLGDFKNAMLEAYPILNKLQNKPQKQTHILSFVDENGNCRSLNKYQIEDMNNGKNENENENLFKNARLIIHGEPFKSPYLRVIDTSLDVTFKNEYERWTMKPIEDDQKLNYKLLACTIEDDIKQSWLIKLEDGEMCNFYTLGNVLLTNTFLKMYVKTFMNEPNKHLLLKALENDRYTVKIIDNRVNTIQWTGSGKAIELHNNGPVVIELNNNREETKDKTI